MSAPVNVSATVVSIGRQCRRRDGASTHAARYGCAAVLPIGDGDGGWLTEGVSLGDGELLGVGVGDCGVGTGTGHRQLGWATGAAGAAGVAVVSARRAAGALAAAGTRPTSCWSVGVCVAAGCLAGAPSLNPGTALTIRVKTA